MSQHNIMRVRAYREGRQIKVAAESMAGDMNESVRGVVSLIVTVTNMAVAMGRDAGIPEAEMERIIRERVAAVREAQRRSEGHSTSGVTPVDLN